MTRRIAVIDDDESMCTMLEMGLRHRQFETATFTDPRKALEYLAHHECDTVLTDLSLPGMDGLEVCRRATAARPDVPVVVMTAFGSMETAIGAIRAGAYDFVTKPVDLDILVIVLERAVAHRDLTEKITVLEGALRETGGFDDIVGQSEPMKRLFGSLNRVASSDASTLIIGESGTGKELIARALHRRSARCDNPFIAVNCAALPSHLLESELFGVRKGAYTDAHADRPGMIIQADRGTLFLDEVADIPLELQPKLLRVLEERTVRPLGGLSETPFDVRLIAATNQDLDRAVAEGNFREDLYYRIAVIPLHVPPLRLRGNDVLLLARTFLERFAEKAGREISGFSNGVARKLLEYNWPGNVRELRNVIERAVALTIHDTLVPDDLPPKIIESRQSRLLLDSADPDNLSPLHEVEQRYIEHVMSAVGGNRSQAARILGIDRKTLYRKLREPDPTGDTEDTTRSYS